MGEYGHFNTSAVPASVDIMGFSCRQITYRSTVYETDTTIFTEPCIAILHLPMIASG